MALVEAAERAVPRPLRTPPAVCVRTAEVLGRYQSVPRGAPTLWDSVRLPPLPLELYLWRLLHGLRAEEAVLVVAWVLLDRLGRSGVCVDAWSLHRLVLAAVVMAHLWLDETGFVLSYYARLGGVRASELRRLQLALALQLRWNLHVEEREYRAYRALMV